MEGLKYYRTFANLSNGFDLYYYDGKDYDIFGGNFSQIDLANMHATNLGLVRNKILESSIDNS